MDIASIVAVWLNHSVAYQWFSFFLSKFKILNFFLPVEAFV